MDKNSHITPNPSQPTVRLSEFLRIIRLCGVNYLKNGGPTSRLENKISKVGNYFGLNVDVWCTPTGLFLTVHQGEETITAVERIRETGNVFLDYIYFGSLLDQMSRGDISLADVEQKVNDHETFRYRSYYVAISAFVVGLMASFIKFGNLPAAFISGLVTACVFVLKRPFVRRFKYSGVFSDFVSSFLVFALSAVAAFMTQQPLILFAIGSLLLIVPGLSLTAAISEIAEHNFVSGTVKLARAVLVLLAMGVAYLMLENISGILGFHENIMADKIVVSAVTDQVLLQLIGKSILIGAFCIFFHIPLKAIPGAIICGLSGVMFLDYFLSSEAFVLAAFTAAFSVGVLSLFFARMFNWPSQIFSTPGILALVPGLLALSTFYDLGGAPQESIAYRVALTSGAIVFGLFSARIPFRIYVNFDDDQ